MPSRWAGKAVPEIDCFSLIHRLVLSARLKAIWSSGTQCQATWQDGKAICPIRTIQAGTVVERAVILMTRMRCISIAAARANLADRVRIYLRNLADHVFAAKRVSHTNLALGIVSPSSINDESVGVITGS